MLKVPVCGRTAIPPFGRRHRVNSILGTTEGLWLTSLGNLLNLMSLRQHTLLPNPRQFHELCRIRFRAECYAKRSVVMARGDWQGCRVEAIVLEGVRAGGCLSGLEAY